MKPARFLGLQALRALHAELVLEPKPGLVSLRDPGSHHDMDAGTFMRSLFALRHYFAAIARAGAAGAPFPHLQALGVQAEARMLAATGGVNTHRGAIFGLGLLCASAGRLHALGRPLDAQGLQDALQRTWGEALRERARLARDRAPRSHGERAARQHRLRGAGDEAAEAFPTLFHTTLPVLQQAVQQGWPQRRARVQALFATLAVLADTNLVHRGGIEGLRFARRAAQDFLAAGGAARPDWLAHARAVHAAFVARRLSPGGSADLLGMACWCAAVCEARAAQPVGCAPLAGERAAAFTLPG